MVIIHALQAGRVIDYPLFSRENSGNIPDLATGNREMFHGTKSDLMHCLLDYGPDSRLRLLSTVYCLIML